MRTRSIFFALAGFVGLLVAVFCFRVQRGESYKDSEQADLSMVSAIKGIEKSGGHIEVFKEGRPISIAFSHDSAPSSALSSHFASFEGLECLMFIDVEWIDSELLRAVCEIQSLNTLDLYGSKFEPSVLQELSDHQSLEILILVETSVQENDLEFLSSLPCLKKVDLTGVVLSKEFVVELTSELAGREVDVLF